MKDELRYIHGAACRNRKPFIHAPYGVLWGNFGYFQSQITKQKASTMNVRTIPGWLEPYKNQWLSAGRLKGMLRIDGGFFGPWLDSVKPRLKKISEPANTRGGSVSKYLVKHVWALSLAHGVKLGPNESILSAPSSSFLVETIRNLEVRLVEESGRVKIKTVYEHAAPDYINLMRLLVTATEPRPTPGVYFLLDEFGNINYIGQSKNVLARMSGHTGKIFSAVKMIKADDDDARLKLESRLIEFFKPPANVNGIKNRILAAA